MRFAPGEPMQEGRRANCYVVVDGLVRVYIEGNDCRQATIRYAARGDVAGTPPAIVAGYSVRADAVTDVSILRIPNDVFLAVAQREVSVAWAIAQHLAELLLSGGDMFRAQIFLPVRARLARHLLDLAIRDPRGLVVVAGARDMANAIGSVREVVYREMKRFEDEGLIERVNGGALLTDSAALHRVASGA